MDENTTFMIPLIVNDVLMIIQVNGIDLRTASHDQAVDIIRNATSPMRFLVQSLTTTPIVCICVFAFVYLITVYAEML